MDELDARAKRLAAAGDTDGAATAVVNALGPRILGYLRALHADEDDAADVFQTWAEDLWRGIGAFRADAPLRTWAYRIAWHASARFRRERWRQRRERLPTSAASRLAASVARSTPLAARDERLEILGKDLAPEDRALLVLRLDQELSWEEIAAVLAEEGVDVSAAALRKRFQRLKDRLGALAREKGLLG